MQGKKKVCFVFRWDYPHVAAWHGTYCQYAVNYFYPSCRHRCFHIWILTSKKNTKVQDLPHCSHRSMWNVLSVDAATQAPRSGPWEALRINVSEICASPRRVQTGHYQPLGQRVLNGGPEGQKPPMALWIPKSVFMFMSAWVCVCAF